MRFDWRVRLFGGLLALAAVPVLLRVPEPLGGVLATALAVTGLFIAVVVAERTVPAPLAQALLRGSARQLEETARGLKLQGAPVYVHDQGNLGEERLFLPAARNEKPVPILDAETVAYAGAGETKLGLALSPPGLALVKHHEASTGRSLAGAGVPDVEAFLQGLGATNDLARSVRVSPAGDAIQVRFAVGAALPPCLDDPADPLCARTGCALCQAAGCALARSLGRPVSVAGAEVEPPWVTLRFEPLEEKA